MGPLNRYRLVFGLWGVIKAFGNCYVNRSDAAGLISSLPIGFENGVPFGRIPLLKQTFSSLLTFHFHYCLIYFLNIFEQNAFGALFAFLDLGYVLAKVLFVTSNWFSTNVTLHRSATARHFVTSLTQNQRRN